MIPEELRTIIDVCATRNIYAIPVRRPEHIPWDMFHQELTKHIELRCDNNKDNDACGKMLFSMYEIERYWNKELKETHWEDAKDIIHGYDVFKPTLCGRLIGTQCWFDTKTEQTIHLVWMKLTSIHTAGKNQYNITPGGYLMPIGGCYSGLFDHGGRVIDYHIDGLIYFMREET